LRALASGTVIAGAILVARSSSYRINESPSLPVGLWQVARLSRTPRTGDVVSFCPPDTPAFQEARRRGYLGWGLCDSGFEPLLKTIAATKGDVVIATADGITVNGQLIENSKPIAADRAGRTLPQSSAFGVVPEGMIWVISSYNALSFDSRYFGPVPAANVLGIAKPIVVSPRRAFVAIGAQGARE
jgi:conjugative transfer signal peptidase TraF